MTCSRRIGTFEPERLEIHLFNKRVDDHGGVILGDERRARPRIRLVRMLGIYFVQQWYWLSDEALEDAQRW